VRREVPISFTVDQAMGKPVISRPIFTCLSAWTTIFVFQNVQAGSRGASWSSIVQFVLSVGFCGWSAASPKKMGIDLGVFTVLYYTFELISIGGLFYEYMKTAGTGQ
jgi:hypothetical protein